MAAPIADPPKAGRVLAIAVGDVVAGKYRVEEVLGEGGMGFVVRARHVELERPVAIKVLHERWLDHPSVVERFLREGRVVARLESEHVARIFDVGRLPEGLPYLVLEHLDGEDLAAVLKSSPRFSHEDAIDLVLQACEGLAAAHAIGIVHRDVKPSNVFLVERAGRRWVKLLDFGIVKDIGEETTTGQGVLGSPAYMAPEQRDDPSGVDARADVYSLGVILYELLVGDRRLPKPPTRDALVARVRELRPDLPLGLEAVVARCLERDRRHRFAGVAELAAALVEHGGGDPLIADRVERVVRRARRTSEPPTHVDPGASVAARAHEAVARPAASPGFFGRGDALARLSSLIDAGERCITVLGTGGLGKTRLVLRWLELHRGAPPQALFCDLSEARSLDDLCAIVARSVGLPSPGVDHPEQRVAAGLGVRAPLLLVLDNCEQAIAKVAAFVHALEPHAGLQVVLTSREVARIPGEVLVELEPLSLPESDAEITGSEAVQLFVDRTRRVRPGYELSGEGEARTVAEIVRRLDGIPLAIELAAARMAVLRAKDLLARLEDRFALLHLGGKAPRDASGRKHTLRGAIDWSWSLLEPVEQSALGQCAVFRGGFDLDAAEAVVDLAGAPVLDVLQGLREKSLVRLLEGDGQVRFGLFESIAEYAVEKLDAEERRAVVDRHAAHYLAQAEENAAAVSRHGGALATRRLLDERENVFAIVPRALAAGEIDRALRALLSLDALLPVHGVDKRNLEALDRALDASSHGATPALVARARIARARIRQTFGDWNGSRDDLEAARALATELSDATLEGRALAYLANLPALQGKLAEAQRAYETALAVHRAANDRAFEAFTLGNLGTILRAEGEVDPARHAFEEALSLARELGDRRLQGHQLARIAQVFHGDGELEEARVHDEAALDALEEAGDRRFLAMTTTSFAGLLAELGAFGEAETRLRDAARIHRELGDLRSLAACDAQLGAVLHEQALASPTAREGLARARAAYDEALRTFDRLGERYYRGIFLAAAGALEAACDDVARATRMLDDAEQLLEGAGAEALSLVVALHRGHLDLAQARARAAVGDDRGAALHRHHATARLAAARGGEESRFARRLLERALDPGGARAAKDPELPRASSLGEPDALVVGEGAAWFRPPRGPVVDVRRRKNVRQILHALVRARADASGKAVTAAELIAAGWPGERLIPRAATTRLHVAITALRNLGLREVLLSTRAGYLIDPDVRLIER